MKLSERETVSDSERETDKVGEVEKEMEKEGKRRNESVWTTLRLNWTFRDDLEDFLMTLEHLACFPSHFQPFSPFIS